MRLEGIKRGRMSQDEKAQIDRLAETLKKPAPSAIARRLNRHPATVAWYMICNGLIERRIRYGKAATHRRSGHVINPYAPDHDRRLVGLRRQQKSFPEIAEILTAEFGIPRTAHSAHTRMTMLAAYEGAPE